MLGYAWEFERSDDERMIFRVPSPRPPTLHSPALFAEGLSGHKGFCAFVHLKSHAYLICHVYLTHPITSAD